MLKTLSFRITLVLAPLTRPNPLSESGRQTGVTVLRLVI